MYKAGLKEFKTMTKLKDITQLMRSKNAGPFILTFDFMYASFEDYCKVRDSGAINKKVFTKLFGTPEEDVEIYTVDAARGIKATIPRPVTQGDLEDSDSWGCQMYGPLMDIEIPD
jgi:hypothetical protein